MCRRLWGAAEAEDEDEEEEEEEGSETETTKAPARARECGAEVFSKSTSSRTAAAIVRAMTSVAQTYHAAVWPLKPMPPAIAAGPADGADGYIDTSHTGGRAALLLWIAAAGSIGGTRLPPPPAAAGEGALI